MRWTSLHLMTTFKLTTKPKEIMGIGDNSKFNIATFQHVLIMKKKRFSSHVQGYQSCLVVHVYHNMLGFEV